MSRITKWHGNFIVGSPGEGCQLCALGSKMVLFITGECDSNCFYCPVMKEKRHDTIFANEQQIETVEQAIKEAKMISALGAGITGGDPSLTFPRVIEYITSLKKEFGSNFHCHLYTSHALTKDQLKQLFSVGLDEIRFHPPSLVLTEDIKKSVLSAKSLKWDVGIEIPAIPDKEKQIMQIVEFAIESQLNFVNLNEFEITEANVERMNKLDYYAKSGISAAVQGSEELARDLLKKYKKSQITLHYCSASYKDRVQLQNRLLRRAENYAKDFDEITLEGLIVRGRVLLREQASIQEIVSNLQTKFNIDSNQISIDKENKYIFLNWNTIKSVLKFAIDRYSDQIRSIDIIHQYPYPNGIITYLEPLYES